MPEEYLNENQLDRLAVVFAKNIAWAHSQLSAAGFGANQSVVAEFIGRQFKSGLTG